MLASSLPGIPVIVGQDRYRSGSLAIKQCHPDLILLDDGFQHIRLARDLNILLLDSDRPLGNGHLLPRGVLREPVSAMRRADAVVLTRAEKGQPIPAVVQQHAGSLPVFQASHQPAIEGVLPAGQAADDTGTNQLVAPGEIGGRRVFAFSAIARNDDFLRSIARLKGELVGKRGFYDHYHYTRSDLLAIGQAALQAGADCLATTAKDFVRIGRQIKFPLELVVVSVAVRFIRSDFDRFVSTSLAGLIQNREGGVGTS